MAVEATHSQPGWFKCLGSCSELEVRSWHEMRNDWQLRLRGRLVGKALYKCTIGQRNTYLKKQIRAFL